LARIAGVNIPKDKRFIVAMTYIYGIGSSTAKKICNKLDIDPLKRTNEISEKKVMAVRSLIEKNQILLKGDLRRKEE